MIKKLTDLVFLGLSAKIGKEAMIPVEKGGYMLDGLPICAVITIMINVFPNLSATQVPETTRYRFKLKVAGDIFFVFLSSEGKNWNEAVNELRQTFAIILEQGREEMAQHPGSYGSWVGDGGRPLLNEEAIDRLVGSLHCT